MISPAALFAAQKLLEAETSKHPLPPGTEETVENLTVQIKLPPNTRVSRSMGQNGDGTDSRINPAPLLDRDFLSLLFQNLADEGLIDLLVQTVLNTWDQRMNEEKAERDFLDLHPLLKEGFQSHLSDPNLKKDVSSRRQLHKSKTPAEITVTREVV